MEYFIRLNLAITQFQREFLYSYLCEHGEYKNVEEKGIISRR